MLSERVKGVICEIYNANSRRQTVRPPWNGSFKKCWWILGHGGSYGQNWFAPNYNHWMILLSNANIVID